MKIFTTAEYDKSSNNEPSIFLAGYIGYSASIEQTWMQRAVSYLKEIGYKGSVYAPTKELYQTTQQCIDWQDYHLKKAKCILFWISPDCLENGCFDAKIRFGEWARSGKIVYGQQLTSPASDMVFIAKKSGISTNVDLLDTIDSALKMLSSNY